MAVCGNRISGKKHSHLFILGYDVLYDAGLLDIRGWNMSDKVFDESLITFPVDIAVYLRFLKT
jgi:hypothetical protein